MFEHPQIPGTQQYVIEVALDGKGEPFENPVAISKDSSTATIIGNLEFGKKYIWRYAGIKNGKGPGWSSTYTFKILNDPHVDRNFYRIRVTTNDSLANSGGLVTLDNERVIIDRAGNFVWFLPPDSGQRKLNTTRQSLPDNLVSDLQVTPNGTITVINHFKAQELDLNGHILWHAPWGSNKAGTPSGNMDNPYLYNHCLKKLASGNYMVIDRQKVTKTIPPGTKQANATTDTTGKVVMADEIVREFDKNGKLVWNWNSGDYFDSIELQDILRSKSDSFLQDPTPGGHMNAFDVDEKNGFVYVSFRNVSRVVKVDKKTGKVVCSWGNKMKYNGSPNGEGFFSKQHETKLLRDGTIAVYNNDLRPVNMNGIGHRSSSVVIFTQPTQNMNSVIAWSFECKPDSGNNLSNRGGSVDEMKNGNLLVGMGTVNKVFEVTRDKKIVWSAIIERFNPHDMNWQPSPLYKAHYASSLYPCYFTVQTNADTLYKKSTTFELRIFNDGTENDTYQVNIQSYQGFYKNQFSTPVISGKKSMHFKIAPDKLPGKNDRIEISVQSKTNPDFKRTVYVQYEK